MLTNDDIAFIKSNRTDILASRTESIEIIHVIEGAKDPYTGESSTTETPETVFVVWKEYSTVANGDRSVVAGVEIRQDDVKVTFDSSVDLSDVERVERGGIFFELIAIDEKGIGETNRYECVARRVV
jgi:hypothetical protein